jgi:carboxypeptidase Q
MRITLSLLFCAALLNAQDNLNTTQDNLNTLSVVNQIKKQAFDKSQVMDTLFYLTDVYGPRLTASPEFNEAAKWAEERLRSYGVGNVHEEEWGPFGHSWSVESYAIDMVTPRFSHLAAAPLAWSGPTNGPVTGEVMVAALPAREYDPKKLDVQIEEYQKKWAGKLRGKVVLLTTLVRPSPRSKPDFERYTEDDLRKISQAPAPILKKPVDWNKFEIPDDPEQRRKFFDSLPEWAIEELWKKFDAERDKLGTFLRQEGVLAVLKADQRAYDALDFAEAAGSEKGATLAPPTFVVTEEQYSRMVRLLDKKIPVTVRVELKVKDSGKNEMAENIIGEIPGQSKPEEIVMVGAHFDSWHTGTGATDNGTGSAVMIEVMRILGASKLPLKRTVRIGLWSGEEQGIYGSKAYVAKHFADPKVMKVSDEHGRFDAYLNFDNGSGKIRGVYLQGNDAARPLFDQWLKPFRDMGVTTLSLQNTGGTDHLSFDAVGLPGFQFIQDPLDYGTVTHHSNMDTYSHAIPEDLMQASAVIATLVYDIANRDDMFPRRVLPEPQMAPTAGQGGPTSAR